MFSGIITDIGLIQSYERVNDDVTLGIKTNLPLERYDEGASVACSGVCLTVTHSEEGLFYTDVSAETLSKTNLGTWTEGTSINLELSLRLGDELCGHMVFGHVDTNAQIVSIEEDGESMRIKCAVDSAYAHYFAPKGSVTLDGISLTINEVEETIFGVNIIPYTWAHTTLSHRKVGDKLNLEIDMLARYVSRMLSYKDRD